MTMIIGSNQWLSNSLTKKTNLLFALILLVVATGVTATGVSAAEEKAAEKPASASIFGMKLDEDGNDLSESDDDGSVTTSESTAEIANKPAPVEDKRTTAEKLESLKSEVLAVNRDLFILEEDLLFPASTQLAAYFSVDVGYFFKLDNIKIKIDDKQVTHHLYTKKDVDALLRGAVQKVYLGNIRTGEHEIVAIVIGTGPHKRKYRKAVSLTFEKSTEAKALEIQLRDDTGKMQPTLKVVEW